MQIEGLEDSVILQIIDDGTFDAGIVVAVVDNTRTGKEVDVRTAVLVKNRGAACACEDAVERTAI